MAWLISMLTKKGKLKIKKASGHKLAKAKAAFHKAMGEIRNGQARGVGSVLPQPGTGGKPKVKRPKHKSGRRRR